MPDKLPVSQVKLIAFLITSHSLLLHPLEAISEQNPELLKILCAVGHEQTQIVTLRDMQQTGKDACAAEQHSPPYQALSPFFVIHYFYPSLKEPGFLIAMDCGRNDYHVSIHFLCTIHLIQPVKNYYHHFLS